MRKQYDREQCRSLHEVLEQGLPLPEALVFADPYGVRDRVTRKVLKADRELRVQADHYDKGLRIRLYGAVAHVTYDHQYDRWMVMLEIGGRRNHRRVYRGGMDALFDVWDAEPCNTYA